MASAVHQYRWFFLWAALVLDGRVALAMRPVGSINGEAPEVSSSDLLEGHWVMLLKKEYAALPQGSGLHVLELLGTERDLAELVEAGRRSGKVRFIEMAELPASSGLNQQVEHPDGGQEAGAAVAAEAEAEAPTEVKQLEKDIEEARLPESIRQALHLDDGSEDPLMRPTLLVCTLVCVVIVAAMFLNQSLKTLLSMSGAYVAHAWIWPIAVVSIFYLHTWSVFSGYYQHLTGHHTVRVMMFMSVAWCIMLLIYEMCVRRCPPCNDRELFVAWDCYTDLTESSFNVTVRFVFQACLMLILVYVAQQYVDGGFPANLPFWRVVLNFGIALALELYLFVQCKQHFTWEDLLRLRTVSAVETVYKHDHEERMHRLRFKPKVFIFRGGDFVIRLAMSMVTNGLFHKFLILSYPVFIFADFGATGWTDVVKDILAITIVTQLDNLVRPSKFITLTGSATNALREQKKKRQKAPQRREVDQPEEVGATETLDHCPFEEAYASDSSSPSFAQGEGLDGGGPGMPGMPGL